MHTKLSVKNPFSTIGGIIACIIWSFVVIVTATLSKAFGPLTALGAQYLIAGVALLGWSFLRDEFPLILIHSLKYYLICGALWAADIILFWVSISSATSDAQLIVVGLLNYLWPSLTFLGGVIVLKKKFHPALIAGIFLAIAGAFLSEFAIKKNLSDFQTLDLKNDINIFAYLLSVMAAISWALYSNFTKILIHEKGVSAVSLFMIVTSLPLLIIGIFNETPGNFAFDSVLLLIVWAVFSAIAYILWDTGMQHGNVLAISSAGMFIPLLSTILTAAFSAAELNGMVLLAALLVVAGAWICQRSADNGKG